MLTLHNVIYTVIKIPSQVEGIFTENNSTYSNKATF